MTITQCLESVGSDFAACELRDQTSSNADWYQRELEKEEWLKRISPDSATKFQKPIYHCLGCLMIFRAKFLRLWASALHPPNSVYFEIYVPTFAYHAGLKLTNLNEFDGLFKYCRYRPEFFPDQIEKICRSNALFVHPAKWCQDDLKKLSVASTAENLF